MLWNIDKIRGPVSLLGKIALSEADLADSRFVKTGAKDITLLHKKILHSPEALRFLEQFAGQPISFSVKTTEGSGVMLTVNGKEKQIATFEELRKGKKGLKGVLGLYESVYKIANRLHLGTVIDEQTEVQKAFAAQSAARLKVPVVIEKGGLISSIKWLITKFCERTIALSDVVSMIRNSLNAAKALSGTEKATKLFTVILPLLITGGIMAIIAGTYLTVVDLIGIAKDLSKGDSRSIPWKLWSIVINLAYVSFGVGMLSATSALIGLIGLYGGFVFYSSVAADCLARLRENGAFRRELNQIYAKNPGSEKEKLAETLRWIQGCVTLTDFDRINGVTDATKWGEFTRRTNGACCTLVRNELSSELIAQVEQGDRAAIEKARAIYEQVLKANFENIFCDTGKLVIVALGILALLGDPLFGAVYFLTGAFLWLCFSDYKPLKSAVGGMAWKIHKKLWWKTPSPVESEGACSKTTSAISSTTSAQNGDSRRTA